MGAWLKRQADAGGAAGTAPVNARQRAGISSLSRRIESVLERKGDPTDELLVEDLRACVTAVGRITGRVDAEEILDAVFGKFCIGK
ncbi:hypothetical protein CLD20_17465 [Afifella sp. IM 167]|nr:hypothetical protein [Afifella sp. IM 167]